MSSLGSIDAPHDAPGPAEDVVADAYEDSLVIYEVGDAGWEARIETPLNTPFSILNVQDHR